MPRSPAVWIVTDRAGTPLVAFTVKYELCSWLWKYQTPESVTRLNGWKIADGDRHWVKKEAAGPWPLDLFSLREAGESVSV